MNELDRIINWYEIAMDSQHVVLEILNSSPQNIPANTVIGSKEPREIKENLLVAENELNDLTILSLVASFEQLVLDFTVKIVEENVGNTENTLFYQMSKYAFKNADRWHFGDILDLFKSVINPQIIGDVKQVYRYRNWVAHGKKDRKPLALEPYIAHERLSQFLYKLQNIV
ncbi:hypothetical protein [Clostridium sp. ZS2-4]|uniref:hypothetical protein n=1 Tax=Clostridium sp. ZS2-4 TaxID=2987703 RepID=UPI00227A9C0F|nr:hypothetical protein [Clostridium sp. ZS2-4]MCY6355267.1 hypothetical protein [Clostridium sp. ZS2-4]